MCQETVARRTAGRVTLSLAATLALFCAPASSRAGIVLTSGSGTVTYSVRPLSPPPAVDENVPIFRASDNSLIYPGNNGFPQLGNESGPVQTANLGTSRSAGVRANPSVIGATGEFGGGFTEVISTTRGSGQGAAADRVGNFYNSTTFVQSSALSGVASVSVSQITSVFTNTAGSAPVNVIPGLVLNVTGALGDLNGSFVAASLTGTLTVDFGEGPFGGENQGQEIIVYTLPPVIIAFNGEDALNTSRTSSGFLFNGADFSAVGSSLFGEGVVIPGGISFTIKSTLTLASDPNSIIRIGTSIPTFFPNISLPDIGGFGGAGDGIPGDVAGVPEPATMIQALSALGVIGFALRRRAR